MLNITLSGDDALQARLDGFAAALAGDLTVKAQALSEALADKVRNEKLSGQALNARSGALRDSIGAEVSREGDAVVASVGSYGDVKYAAIQEYGGKTGAHEILPTKGKVLAFLAGGAMRFARKAEHPGSLIPERPYLRSSLAEMSADILAALAATPIETWEDA